MKKKAIKILIFIIVLTLMSPITIFAESNSRVGEYVPLNSGGLSDSSSGISNSSTLTERERQAASTNSSASQQIKQEVGEFIESYTVDTGYVMWQDGGYTFITKQTVTAEDLKKLIETAGMYDPIGYGYNIPVYTPQTPMINNDDRSAFRNLVSYQMGGSGGSGSGNGINNTTTIDNLEITSITDPIWDVDYINWTEWDQDSFGNIDELIEELLRQGGERIRVDLDGGFIDYPNMETRYRMLDQYLNAVATADTINMQYILEYRIENTAHNTIYRMTGQNGMNSYTWDFTNQSTGESYSRYNLAPAIYHQFMRAGTYKIDVDKEVCKTFCDAFTISVNEYWVVEDTGQVVWKRETKGKNIDQAVPALELGLRNLVMYNTPEPDELPSMETIHVATMYHTVTEDMLNFTIPAEGSFREFYTERIQ
ncbi:MAG: hypothetical protein LBI03_00340 [Clostridiales bacterium]|jgi:hypothetical protein|nr:hypothetical protein [Clostridiales bacterium]